MSETEQNKTEEPTPFKLKKAREKGNVAKGTDLAFFGTLVALCIYAVVFAPSALQNLANMMRLTFLTGIENAGDPLQAPRSIAHVYQPAVETLALIGGMVFVAVILMQMIQIGGLMFTAHPIKPDFSRINPGKGLKRIFSMRTLKEALKNIFKMSVYLGCTYVLIIYCIRLFGHTIVDAQHLISALQGSGLRLLFMFTVLSIFFAALDQIIVRKEFTKEMRMSRSEVKREHKDREGEPRLKQKRKQLHAEFVKQTESMNNLPGSDILIVNPQHYAVGLSYKAETMDAPQMTTKGRNKFALILKRKAFELGIPIIEHPALARAIYKSTAIGDPISGDQYQNVADLYLKLYRNRMTEDPRQNV